jgi:ZIP family zinc transporter
MAVGLAFALAGDGIRACLPAVTLALGIGLQNIPEGAAVALPLCRDGVTRGRAFLLGVLSGAAEVLFGLFAVLFAARVHLLMPLLLSFAAGAMLYVTFRDLLPSSAQTDPSPRPALCAILGFVLMMALDVALG